ncbi:BAG family molecular chaperone regulator 2 isoform X2 [Agrilus planipennis]|uniref:BAG family molecular chaperone regulator 2 isoform X2 n=1 Tax=Agrilus planipennis TaxID=224129 RepID=A0A1W4XKP1_AGRPL|nr:BAG family molecular chaperone regulator 2 isoform X2 [Agrilus planipennis]
MINENFGMEVDLSGGSSTAPAKSGSLPQIDEYSPLENKSPKQRLLELLDVLESHVEKLRKEASRLEEERDKLLASLDSIKGTDLMLDLNENERDDVLHYADRILNRCATVELTILTQRDQTQEDALHQINHLIDYLVMSVRNDPEGAKSKCIAYMNACSSHFVEGATDKNFESALLGCTVDDQKRVKKRLQGLLSYFDRVDVSSDLE